MFEHYGEQRATEIIKGIVATLKPIITDGHLALARATGAGEYAISLNNYVNLTMNVKLAGGPIDVWAMDPVALMFGQVGVSALAPNPNAARLAANFMLSQEAQQFIAKFGRLPTRNDVTDNPPGTVAMLQAEEGHSGAADAGRGEGLAAPVPGTVQAAVMTRIRRHAMSAETSSRTWFAARRGCERSHRQVEWETRDVAQARVGIGARAAPSRDPSAQPRADRLRDDRRLAGVRAAGGAVLHRLHRGHRLRAGPGLAREFHRRPIRAGTSSGCSAIR